MADAGLIKEYKRLAVNANARLKRIENDYSKRPGYENISKWAYKSARKDIEAFGMPLYDEQTRFSLATKGLSDKQLMARINAVNRFMESPTSTIRGINSIFNNQVKVINEKYGTDFTWDELASYFEQQGSEKLEASYAYNPTIFQVAGTIKDAVTPEEIEEAIEKNKKIPDKEVALEIVKMLKQNGIDTTKIF